MVKTVIKTAIVTIFVIFGICILLYNRTSIIEVITDSDSLPNIKKDSLRGDTLIWVAKSLSHYEVSKEIKVIGNAAFKNCKVESVTFQPLSSLKVISENAFKKCSELKKIVLPESLKYIGRCAFEDCISLKEITIPQSVSHIGVNPFVACNLRIVLPSKHKNYIIEDDCLIDKEKKMIISYTGTQKHIVIPSNVLIVGEKSFARKSCINIIDMSKSQVREIHSFAFAYCSNVKDIIFPNQLGYIGTCNPFVDIHFPNKNRIVINRNFVNDKGYLIGVRDSVLIAYLDTVPEIELYRLVNPIDTIGAYSFAFCNFITEVNYARTRMDKNALYGCNDTIVNMFKTK